MLSKLKQIIKKKGLMYAASEMGYRSDGAIRLWLKQNRIPNLAKQRVQILLDKEIACVNRI